MRYDIGISKIKDNNSHTNCHWHCMCAFKWLLLLFVVVFHLRKKKNVCFFRVTSSAHLLYVHFKLFFAVVSAHQFGGVVIMIVVEWLNISGLSSLHRFIVESFRVLVSLKPRSHIHTYFSSPPPKTRNQQFKVIFQIHCCYNVFCVRFLIKYNAHNECNGCKRINNRIHQPRLINIFYGSFSFSVVGFFFSSSFFFSFLLRSRTRTTIKRGTLKSDYFSVWSWNWLVYFFRRCFVILFTWAEHNSNEWVFVSMQWKWCFKLIFRGLNYKWDLIIIFHFDLYMYVCEWNHYHWMVND